METEAPQPNAHLFASKAKPVNTTTILLFAAVLALASANIAIVANDRAHDVGHSILKTILASVLTEAALSRVLSSSPMASKQALEKKHAALEVAHREIEAKHADLKRVSTKRIVATQTFTKHLAKRVAFGASRAAATAIPKSVPFVGAAVVVAVTTADLYDSCLTLKEISGLNEEFEIERVDKDATTVCGYKVPSLPAANVKPAPTAR